MIFGITVDRNLTTKETGVTLVAKIVNENSALLGMQAKLSGNVNGKEFISIDGKNYVEFKSYASASMPASLILTFKNIPTDNSQSTLALAGEFKYDVYYYFAPAGTRKRRTMKVVSFAQKMPIRAEPGVSELPISVLFKDEKEVIKNP